MIDYTGFLYPKSETAAVIARDDKRAALAKADRDAKADVMARDKRTCRVCGRVATEVHEALTFKSKGGVASLSNSIAVCAAPKGRCHQLLQAHRIRVVGRHCSNPLRFEMRADVAAAVFGRRARPATIAVLA